MTTHVFQQLVTNLDLRLLPPEQQAELKAQFLRWALTEVLMKLERDGAYDSLREFADLIKTDAQDSQLENAFTKLSAENRQKISDALHSVQHQFQRVHYSQVLSSLELDLELAESESEKQEIQQNINELTKKVKGLRESFSTNPL